MSAPAATAFVEGFRQKHGRAPRLLHIGNIANNAYLNAKLLNEAGFDCDVICYDYYHIMGCPEWEDADFDGDVGDHFRPDWVHVDLGGFERPRWFAQGPQLQCLDYLIARRTGAPAVADELWRNLGELNHTRQAPALEARPHAILHWLAGRILEARFALSRIHDSRDLFKTAWQWLTGRPGTNALTRALSWLAVIAFVLLFPVALVLLFLLRGLRVARRRILLMQRPTFPAAAVDLVRKFAAQFPDRPDQLTVSDIAPFAPLLPRWTVLFRQYDIVQAYSTDGFLPLLAKQPYCAFEHGTLREIPFRQTGEGRRTALAYRLADHVFVTNFDCLENAKRLAPGRHTLINHPFDEDHGLATSGWQTLRRSLSDELESALLFFFPTRHDWVKGTGYADKGNDVFLRALAALRANGFPVGAVCCEWGANLPQSKALLAELGVSRYVKWVRPLPTVRFERMARAAHCAVDQFVLGSFGGVMFKAMAVGAPVLTFLDKEQLREQYPHAPPVVNCKTDGDIVDRMSELLRQPGELARIGESGREWMKRFHSKHGTVLSQLPAFERIVTDARPS